MRVSFVVHKDGLEYCCFSDNNFKTENLCRQAPSMKGKKTVLRECSSVKLLLT